MHKELRSIFKVLRKRVRRVAKRSQPHVGVMVSHPKSGRTWVRVMLDELGLPFECTHDGVAAACPFDHLTLGEGKKYRQKPVLFMSRDPRDTVVSYYFQRTLRTDRYEGTMAEFIRDPSFGIERIARYNLTWLQLGAELPAFLPITYEALRSSPITVMGAIAEFLEAELPRAELERVCSNNTFEKMRAREAGGEYNERYRRMLRPASQNPDSFKVRRGKVGGYPDYLSEDDIAYCDDVLSRLDYFDRLDQLMPGRGPALQPAV